MNKRIAIPILALILILIDLYAFEAIWALIGDTSPQFQQITSYLYWGLSAFTLVGLFAYHFVSPEILGKRARMLIMVFIFSVYIAKTFMIFSLILDDLRRLLMWIWAQLLGGSFEVDRSLWILGIGAFLAVFTLIAILWGIVVGAHDYAVRKSDVFIKDLPEAFEGFKAIQISDIHSGTFWNKKAVHRGIDLILEQRADVIFFTGDLVNNVAEEIEAYTDVFSRLEAPMGVYSVLGNHDYGDYVYWPTQAAKRANLDKLMRLQREMGWDLLINEHRILEKEGAKIAVLGIENWGAKARFPKYGDLAKAYKGTENIPVKVLLSHDPSHWLAEVIPQYPDIDLTLSGHTHGMHFGIDTKRFKWSPVKYVYQQWADLYKEGQQYLYVNRGFGYLGFPGRVGIRPEITVLTLRKG
ncbi:MAG: metallophosphoesterase [Bacteroidota bacterium]